MGGIPLALLGTFEKPEKLEQPEKPVFISKKVNPWKIVYWLIS